MLVLRSDRELIGAVKDILVGQSVTSVVYRQTLHSGLGDVPDADCHEIDLDVILRLSSGQLSLTWDRDDMTEGISAGFEYDGPVDGLLDVDVSQSPQWRGLLGQRILSVEFGWQVSEADGPESLWTLRLDFPSGASVVVAIGEVGKDAVPSYFPDSLVVLFDEEVALSYTG